jgi:hypothetical protein
MVIVAAAIACATFNMVLLVIILSVAVIGLVILRISPRYLKMSRNDGLLILTLSESDYLNKNDQLINLLNERLTNIKLESLTKDGDQSIISYTFTGIKDDTVLELHSGLKDLMDESKFSIFLNKPEAV